MLKSKVISDLDEFEHLGAIWDKLLGKSLDNDIFLTWEWLWTWWKYFGKGRQLRVIAAEENDKIIGIAPFMLSHYNFRRLGKLDRIEFIGFPHADYNNFILLEKNLMCLKLFMDVLMDFSDWDLLDLRDIREETASAEILRMLVDRQKSKLKLSVGTICPYIKLPNSIEDFMPGLSRNIRRNLRKRMRRLNENFRVEFKTQRDFSSVDKAMETFFRLHQMRWKSKGEKGAFASEDFRNFHLELARIFDKKNWLDLRFLTVDNEHVAAAYTFDYNGKKYGYLTGFDPEFGKFSVGNLLKLHLIEECIKRGFIEYDLTRGFEPYKADWATNVRRTLDVRYVQKGLFARAYCWVLQKSFSRYISGRINFHLTRE